MPFTKIGEALESIRIEDVSPSIAMVDPNVLENFRKFASELKKIAPKAEDFLYFSAIFMHAAEASAINDDGTPKLTAKGDEVKVGWDTSGGTWRWMSNDPNIKPYKNSNGDIFSEGELIKAHKKWIGKPLCVDHKSSSVEHVRGFIVDTYYDRINKRVIGLCALDKASYPKLARQISTGVSNCVSMGTAVGKAICTDCARVARTEADFCDHMRHKSGYGEINVDLNPIELSIVVNGADPKANIKHIIASAQTLNNYVESKQKELQKIAEDSFKATLTFNVGDTGSSPNVIESGKVTNVDVSSKSLEDFKRDVDKAITEYQKIQQSLECNEENVDGSGNDSASNQLEEIENASPTADSGLPPPHARFASDDAISELRDVTKSIETKLNQIKTSLDKLANGSNTSQEENMSDTNINKKGYFQGGGGVNEPTPGQAKYPKDGLNEQLRDHEDKQMVGQDGFPGVGPVDGMHDSPDSAEPKSELERKKMLARAQADERAMRRQAVAALVKQNLEDKKAWFQNGLDAKNVNTPTPGQVKYPIDKLNEQLRDHEDKQMVGQKPFPGVGPVDGMHPSPASADPSDELKRKELLQRASLRARFVKAAKEDGSQDISKSAWEVFLGDKLLLTASVDELSNGMSEELYEKIATKPFGVKLIERVKKDGAEKVSSLLKKAQMPPAPEAAPPAEAPAALPAAGDTSAPADSSAAPPPPPAGDASKDGDPKDTIQEISSKITDLVSDMGEAVSALTGEQKEMGEPDDKGAVPEMAAAASFGNSSALKLRKDLNGGLTTELKKSIANLDSAHQELQMISGLYDNNAVSSANSEQVSVITHDALNEAKEAIAKGFLLMTAFVKYARGTNILVKQAEMEAELNALDSGDSSMASELEPETNTSSDSDLMNLINDSSDSNMINALLADDMESSSSTNDLDSGSSSSSEDANDATIEVKPGEQVPANLPKDMEVEVMKNASLNTKEGRAVLRAKLAADATGKEDSGEVQDMSKQKFSDMLDQADNLADGQTQLDVKPSDSLGLIETLPEQNKAMMDLAKAPPKVRKEAESIERLVSQGKLAREDVDSLIAEGLDKDAVAYWKKFYGQVDGGSEFASELVKEHAKAELEAELNKFKIKIARAYELTYEMVDRGLCHNDRNSISNEVDRVMKMNDDGFEAMKRVVAKSAPIFHKEAGRMPQVGVNFNENPPAEQLSEKSLQEELSSMFSVGGSRRTMF